MSSSTTDPFLVKARNSGLGLVITGLVCLAAIGAIVVLDITHPNDSSNTLTDIHIVMLAVISLIFIKMQELAAALDQLHTLTNSRLSQLLAITTSESYLRGFGAGGKEASDAATAVALKVAEAQAITTLALTKVATDLADRASLVLAADKAAAAQVLAAAVVAKDAADAKPS